MGKNILIIEDDVSLGIDISMMLESDFDIQYAIATTYQEAIDQLKENAFDLIIADVFLNDNFQIFDLLESHGQDQKIIFMSSMEEQDILKRTQEYDNYIFLIKPFSLMSLSSAVSNCLGSLTNEMSNEQLIFPHNGKLISIDPRQISYITTDGNFCNIHTDNKRIVVRESLDRLLSRINLERLLRIHRQHAINLEKINALSRKDNSVKVGGNQLPIGRKYKPSLMEAIKSKFILL